MTRVLQIGSDRSIFDAASASAARQRAYGKQFGSLNIVVFSLRRHGVRDVRLSEQVRAYATNSLFRFLYPFDVLACALRLPRPDVVSVQDPFEAGLAGWLIARAFGVPLHVQVHTDFLSPEFPRLSFLNRLRIPLARFILRRASRIRVVSERIADSLKINNYKLKTIPTVLPIFVDVEKYRTAQLEPRLAARDHLFSLKLLVVSRLEPEKNVALAIHAFAKAALEKSCLIIIGEGREKQALYEMAKARGVAKWVFFEGNTDPAQYYKMADVVLCPSRYEGYGMVVVEALAAGTPVIATDVGIAREAGAIIAEEDDFAKTLVAWRESGPREGSLKNYPYKNFEEYVEAYCADIAAVYGDPR